MKGVLINFEGVDGSGKRTQSRLLKDALLQRGFKVAVFSYPDYGSEYGKRIKAFLEREVELSVEEQFLLFLLDIVKDQGRVRGLLQDGWVVILDRYFLSTLAYQSASGFDYEAAKEVVKLLNLTTPSLVFYLEVPVETAYRRKGEQNRTNDRANDRFESNTEFLEKIEKVYERLFNDLPLSLVRLNGAEEPHKIAEKVLFAVEALVKTTT